MNWCFQNTLLWNYIEICLIFKRHLFWVNMCYQTKQQNETLDFESWLSHFFLWSPGKASDLWFWSLSFQELMADFPSNGRGQRVSSTLSTLCLYSQHKQCSDFHQCQHKWHWGAGGAANNYFSFFSFLKIKVLEWYDVQMFYVFGGLGKKSPSLISLQP